MTGAVIETGPWKFPVLSQILFFSTRQDLIQDIFLYTELSAFQLDRNLHRLVLIVGIRGKEQTSRTICIIQPCGHRILYLDAVIQDLAYRGFQPFHVSA